MFRGVTLGLYSIIASYQPDPLTLAAFFVCATAAGFATVVSVMGVMFGGGGGGLRGGEDR